ncbi:MAG: PH domain-containing protein [Candidatus Nitrosopolaris sp.]
MMRMYNQYNKNEIDGVGTWSGLVPDEIKLLLGDDEQVFFKPNDRTFITNQRVLIRPRYWGQLKDIGFDQIKEVNLKKGIFRTELTLIRTEEDDEDIEITNLKNYEAFKIYAHLKRCGVGIGYKVISKDRLHFSEVVKNNILVRQDYQCGQCDLPLKYFSGKLNCQFHHKDGDHSNNVESNCEALCPNCHAIKTRNTRSH